MDTKVKQAPNSAINHLPSSLYTNTKDQVHGFDERKLCRSFLCLHNGQILTYNFEICNFRKSF